MNRYCLCCCADNLVPTLSELGMYQIMPWVQEDGGGGGGGIPSCDVEMTNYDTMTGNRKVQGKNSQLHFRYSMY